MTSSLGVLWGMMTGGPALDPSVGNGGGGNYTTGTMTLSAGVITDAVREADAEGDGETPPAGVGIWPAVTNIVTQSIPGADATTGVTLAGAAEATLTKVTDATAPFQASSTTVWLLDNSGGATDATVDFAGNATAAAHTGSIWAKAITGTPTVSIEGGGTPTDITATASYARFSQSLTANLNDNLRITAPAGAVVRFTAGQLETGEVATPFVVTDGGTAARVAGRVRQPVADLFTATQGWVCTAFAPGVLAADIQTGAYIFSYYDDDDNRLDAYYDTQPAIIFLRYASGAGSTDGIVEPAWDAGNVLSIAAWTATAIKTSIGGNFTAGTANNNIPTIASTVVDIGTKAGVQFPIDGRILWRATGSGTLTNADAAALNTLVDVVPTWAQVKGVLPATALLTSLYPAVGTAFQKVSA